MTAPQDAKNQLAQVEASGGKKGMTLDELHDKVIEFFSDEFMRDAIACIEAAEAEIAGWKHQSQVNAQSSDNWRNNSSELQTELTALRAEREQLQNHIKKLIAAGDSVAAMFDPGPIPADQPTESDMTVGNWEYAQLMAHRALQPQEGQKP
jgi:FtsZ-binding cell division protein ZapB